MPFAATAEDAVLVIDTSAILETACVMRVTTTPLVLLVVSGSFTPGGGDTVAILLSVPDAGAVPMIVTVTEPPLGIVGTDPETLPGCTTGSPHTAPPTGFPHVAVTAVRPAGSASA